MSTELRAVPIGAPLPGTDAYVLDAALRPVRRGAIGELYLAGSSLARGYLGQPALTSARFVANPFSSDGARMYRTGDLVRLRTDGQLEFAGRADNQVKIRGFRIEPAEIEAVLAEHHSVADVAVVPVRKPSGDTVLAAYLVPATEFDESALRAHAGARLPEYMVPSRFVPLASLPVTANGKLDRSALPALAESSPAIASPRTPREDLLASLFAEILGIDSVDSIDVDDDFFELGGHSLLATRLISRVRETLEVELTLRTLFDSATVSGLASVLSPGASRPALTRGPDTDELSYAQQRMVFLQRLDGGVAYTMPILARISGDLNTQALSAALSDVVTRHESLRTRYPNATRSVLGAGPTLTISTVHSDIDVAIAVPFDLSSEPPLRATLYPNGELLLLLHHIAADEWSLDTLLTDLATAYRARRDGVSPHWTELPVSYRDYARWQRELLGSDSDPDSLISRQLDFWQKTLAGIPEQLTLPTDQPRTSAVNGGGDHLLFTVDTDTANALRRLATGAGASMLMVTQAAVATLLTRLGAGTDIPLGTPVAGRPDSALDQLVGFFVNTLVLRTDTSGNPSFRDLLDRVRHVDLAAFDHQDVPFERLVEALNPARSVGRHPLFQVMISYRTATAPQPDLAEGLTMSVTPVGAKAAKFDLTVAFNDGPDGVVGILEYRTDLFTNAGAQRIADQLVRVLDHVARNPDTKLGALNVLTPDERRTILIDWNDTAHSVPLSTVSGLFEAQVERTPDSIAVWVDGVEYTYTELNDRANRIARLLIDRGAEPERVVGLSLPRNLDMIAAQIAVMKTGAAFLALDPDYPAERQRQMTDDAAPICLLTNDDLDTELPPADNPRVTMSVDNLAYVIFTSGSTGRPKGVLISHRGVAKLVATQNERFGHAEGRRVLYFASPSFDAAFWQMCGALLSGGTLVVIPSDRRVPGQPLADFLAETRVDVAGLPPSVLAAFPPDCDLPPELTLVVGAEKVPPEVVQRWGRGRRLINAYGPTEATVNATLWDCDPDSPGDVPIGLPDPGTQAYVVDSMLSPVPPGVIGELYLAGEGLARGYHAQPGMTAERFVANPFGRPGERMYRTGDLARWRPDGVLEFQGRSDEQIKVRGFRIEPGEIISVLAQHSAVTQAAVVLRDNRLVAYLVGTPAELRQFVSSRLPDYMLPADYVWLDQLPLTSNGKLDRNALPAPAERVHTGRSPRNDRERTLCDIIAAALGLTDVGIDDNFFDLGGHSLVAAQVADEASKALGVRIGVADVFAAPTVAALGSRHSDPLGMLLPLRSGGDVEPLFCLPPLAGMSWCYAGLVQHIDARRGVYGLQARNISGERPAASTMSEMVNEYVECIRSVQSTGPYHLLGWSFGGAVAHAVATRLQADGDEVSLLAMLDSYPSARWNRKPTETDALRSALYMAGIELDDDVEVTTDTVAELLRTSSPVLSQLADFDPARMIANYHSGPELERTANFQRFDGDLVFFTAMRTKDRLVSTYQDWKPFVSGDIHEIEVDATHQDMVRPESLRRVGEVVSPRLSQG